MKKKLLVLLAMVFSVLFLVACGGDPDKKEGAGTGKDTLVIAQGADAKSLDPHASNDNPSSRIRIQIYDRLMDLDDNGVPQPMLAESWERPDDKTIIFHLRKGVKFHNGDEMKASDVKFSLERALASPEVSHILAGINGVEVLDDYTVKVTTEKPMAAILNNLSHTTIAVLSEKATTEAGDKFGQNPIGTGPYKFVSWQSGDRVTLEAFPEYWKGEAPTKNVVFRNIVEETNRTIGLETGELDIIYDIQGMDKNKLKDDERFNLIEGPQVSITYLGFNMKKAPYDNPKVREAISYAIDQKPIIDTVFLGAGEPANSIIGPNVWGYYDVEKFTQDVAKANALLAVAGYPNGFKAKIWVNDKYTYSFGLWLRKKKPEQLYFQENIFNTEDTKYTVLKFRSAVNSMKQTSLYVTSTLIDGQTPPNLCASMIYDVFALLILLYTKKLTPEDFIKEKEGLDQTIINSFPFPASIEESNLIVIEEGEKVVYVK